MEPELLKLQKDNESVRPNITKGMLADNPLSSDRAVSSPDYSIGKDIKKNVKGLATGVVPDRIQDKIVATASGVGHDAIALSQLASPLARLFGVQQKAIDDYNDWMSEAAQDLTTNHQLMSHSDINDIGNRLTQSVGPFLVPGVGKLFRNYSNLAAFGPLPVFRKIFPKLKTLQFLPLMLSKMRNPRVAQVGNFLRKNNLIGDTLAVAGNMGWPIADRLFGITDPAKPNPMLQYGPTILSSTLLRPDIPLWLALRKKLGMQVGDPAARVALRAVPNTGKPFGVGQTAVDEVAKQWPAVVEWWKAPTDWGAYRKALKEIWDSYDKDPDKFKEAVKVLSTDPRSFPNSRLAQDFRGVWDNPFTRFLGVLPAAKTVGQVVDDMGLGAGADKVESNPWLRGALQELKLNRYTNEAVSGPAGVNLQNHLRQPIADTPRYLEKIKDAYNQSSNVPWVGTAAAAEAALKEMPRSYRPYFEHALMYGGERIYNNVISKLPKDHPFWKLNESYQELLSDIPSEVKDKYQWLSEQYTQGNSKVRNYINNRFGGVIGDIRSRVESPVVDAYKAVGLTDETAAQAAKQSVDHASKMAKNKLMQYAIYNLIKQTLSQ